MIDREEQTILEDEGAGYIISVSDLMAGLLFIFIITLMVFVINFQHAQMRTAEEKELFQSATDELTNIRQLRTQLIEEIREKLESYGIQVEVDTKHGILHLTKQAINFPSGKAELPEEELVKLDSIGEVLSSIIPCYSANEAMSENCNSQHRGKLESVFIEGHTDNVPCTNSIYRDNWELSAHRAIYTFRYMAMKKFKILSDLTNSDNFPIFSVSGYGEGRPRNRYDYYKPDAANRRIDLRFIMSPPKESINLIQTLRKEGL